MASPSSNVMYCQGTFSTKNPTDVELKTMQAEAQALNTSGATTVILGQWHVSQSGDVSYNDTLFSDVQPNLVAIMPLLKAEGGSVQKVLITFGPFYGDFQHMAAHQSAVQSVLTALQSLGVDGVDWDLEQQYPQSQIANLTTMTTWARSAGLMVTAAPYAFWAVDFWAELRKAVGPDGFSWWNLQLYGGAVYSQWISRFGSDTVPFFVPGWKIGTTGDAVVTDPNGLQQAVASVKAQFPALQGAFVWKYESTNANGFTTNEYVQAIAAGLDG